MNVKRYLIILLVFLTLFIGTIRVYAKKNGEGIEVPDDNYDAETDQGNLSSYKPMDQCENNGSCFNGLGLRLRLIYYDKSKSDDETILSTIHIINPSMLKDVTLTNGVPLPSSEADLGHDGYQLTQIDPSDYVLLDDDGIITEEEPSSAHQDGQSFTCPGGAAGQGVNNQYLHANEHEGANPSYYGGTQHITGYSYEYDYSECLFHISNMAKVLRLTAKKNKELKSQLPLDPGYLHYTFKYISNFEKIVYLANSTYLKMNGAEDYIPDYDITEENIKSNYLDNTIMKKYTGSIEKIEKYFKYPIKAEDIGKYYIRVEAIYRFYFKEPKVNRRQFLATTAEGTPCESKDITKTQKNGSTYNSNDSEDCNIAGKKWYAAGSFSCEEQTQVPVGASCSKKQTAPVGTTCSLNATKTACTDSTNCNFSPSTTTTETIDVDKPDADTCSDSGKCNCDGCTAADLPYYDAADGACGIKNHHMIYAYQWNGYSELRYTMSEEDQSCKDDVTATALADLMENNKHCEISKDDPTYSPQEQANQCANTGYKYYIGPDPDRALVGMTSSNKYNLYRSDGKKCRSGAKHYYVMDITPNLCKDICEGTGSKDSNSYLKCAENYCDHDVDYSLGGQPFVRKRDCILNSCGYIYGQEPTMGSKASTNRQSVSSCANSKLFKTGSDTTYTLEKIPYISSSSCGMTSTGPLNNKVGKDSICIGDNVTDYNNDPNDDTAFDQRTYINIACQETDSITSVGGIANTPVYPGNALSYALNTKGQITCVAFFDYEQWKVDYAVIPSQDIIRRKRLDYIYDKYNNLMKNGYTVPSNVSSFYAYDLDGITYTHWEILESEGLGQIKWDDYIIDIKNSVAQAESKETLKSDKIKKQEENPLVDATEGKATLSVVPSVMDLTKGIYKSYTTGKKTDGGVISDKSLIKVANNDITNPDTGTGGNTELQGYLQTSTDTKSYVYAKYCVNREGAVTRADDSGVCSDGTIGNNKFYTDLNDKLNNDADPDIHNIKGIVDVQSSLPKSNLNIYKNEDICPIMIVDDPITIPKTANCKFKIIKGDSIGDRTFLNGTGVEVMIEFQDANGSKIKPDSFSISITSPYRKDTSTNKYNTLKLKDSALAVGFEDIRFEGTFTATDYSTNPCYKVLTIIQKGNMCDIEKKDTKLYNVNTSVANPSVVMGGMLNQRIIQEYNGNHYPTNLGRLDKPISENGLYKYKLDLKKSEFDDQSVVVGYVNNGSKGEFCYRPEGSPKQCVKNTDTGYGLYLPGEYANITKYCKENWAKDTYGYESEFECVDTCARCPTHENEVIGWEGSAEDTRDNLDTVYNFCDAYATYGYSSKETCVNLVYERCINPGQYKYRPVNEKNPFPSAVDNANIAPGYKSGDRIIGSNWKGKEYYITEGSPDTPRYQIALTTDRIRRIKSEINKDTIAGIYTQLNPAKDSVENKPYMSKYVRDTSYFYDMFCIIQSQKTNSTTGGCEIK